MIMINNAIQTLFCTYMHGQQFTDGFDFSALCDHLTLNERTFLSSRLFIVTRIITLHTPTDSLRDHPCKMEEESLGNRLAILIVNKISKSWH